MAPPQPESKVLRTPAVGGQQAQYMTGHSLVPLSFDDLTGEFGLRVYREMLREPAIEAALSVLKGILLAAKPSVVPAVTDEDADDFEAAQKAAELIDHALKTLETPLLLIVEELLDALALKTVPAEIIWSDDSWNGKGVLLPKEILVKPRETVGYVDDEFGRRLGYVPRKPGIDRLNLVGGMVRTQDILPREKFLVLEFPKSVLRSAYNPYRFKMQVLPEHYRFLVNFATGRLIGITPEGAEVEVNERGGSQPLQTPEQRMLEDLLQLRGSSAGAFPYGTEVEVLQSTGDGSVFINTADWCDRQMCMGVASLWQAILEAKHSNKANGETAFAGLVLINQNRRDRIAHMINSQLVRPIIEFNLGKDALRIAPTFQFARDKTAEFAALASAIAQLYAGGYIDDSQLQALDAEMGLPPRDMEAMEARKQSEADRKSFEKLEREKSDEEPPDEE